MSFPRKPVGSAVDIELTDTATLTGRPGLRPRRQKLREFLLPWWLEICSLILSTACVLAVLGLVSAHEGRKVPQWPHVTFNFLIGVLAQASQLLLTGPLGEALGQLKWAWYWDEGVPRSVRDFDRYSAASRGPYGAASMLVHSLRRPTTFLASFLTVAAIASHPFLQNVVTYPLVTITSDGQASVPLTTWSAYGEQSKEGSDSQGSSEVLSSITKGAFYAGLYDLEDAGTISASCSTGNCSWPQYHSLAVCSACSDISALVRKGELVAGYNNEDYQWTLPTGMEIEASLSSMLVANNYPSIRYETLANYAIVNITLMSFPPGTYVGFSPPTAFDCVLYFCVNAYEATVTDGRLNEKHIASFPNATTTHGVAEAAMPPPTGGQRPDARPSDPVTFDGPWTYNNTISIPGHRTNYAITTAVFSLTRQWFQSILKGAILATRSLNGTVDDVSQVLYDSLQPDSGPTVLMDRIARSLTVAMRNGTGEVALGTTRELVSVVQPHYIWFILPLAVLVLALVLMIVVIANSARRRIPVWKSDMLPCLVYGLDDQASAAIAGMNPRLSALQDEAEKYVMAMSRGDRKWGLEGSRKAGYL